MREKRRKTVLVTGAAGAIGKGIALAFCKNGADVFITDLEKKAADDAVEQITAAGGPMTESFYYESAAFIAAAISSGVSFQTPHPARAVLPDYVTPMEMRTTTEIALACAGMGRKEADRIVKELLPKYEEGLSKASAGSSYSECFDLQSGKASDEYLSFVAKIKKELSKTGIALL